MDLGVGARAAADNAHEEHACEHARIFISEHKVQTSGGAGYRLSVRRDASCRHPDQEHTHEVSGGTRIQVVHAWTQIRDTDTDTGYRYRYPTCMTLFSGSEDLCALYSTSHTDETLLAKTGL